MWTVPHGWTLEHRGNALHLASARGRIVIVEGLAPVDDVAALVERALPGAAIERIEDLVTCEGERAVIATTSSVTLGFVLLDDTYVRIVGHDASTVRELVVGTRVYMTGHRRRRFGFRVPAGFTRVGRSSDETYRAGMQSVTVMRALPISARVHASPIVDLLGATDGVTHVPITTRAGLRGLRWQRTLDGFVVHVVALSDGAYDYFARAITAGDNDATLITMLVESFEPIPLPRAPASTSALAHFAD